MYSQCPECDTWHELTAEQLRTTRGMLPCPQCGKRFDALQRLAEQPDVQFADTPFTQDPVPNPAPVAARYWQWGIASLLAFWLLLGQIYIFEGETLAQRSDSRLLLQQICQLFHCRLPDYKNLDELSVLHSDFQPAPDDSYVFSLVLTNQSVFAQRYPDVLLSLRDFNGEILAERVFSPKDYRADANAPLAADETAEISLSIAAPDLNDAIGGYTFSLL